MAKQQNLLRFTISVDVGAEDFANLTEMELDGLSDTIADEVEMGLKAVAENVRTKFGDGKLIVNVEER